MARGTPTITQCARSLWLLGLDWPESADEITAAWKQRVARAHPDRHSERSAAATRLTAAFNEAREICEWWLEQDTGWPKPQPPAQLRARQEDERQELRSQSEVRRPDPRAPFRVGDAVQPASGAEDLLRVTAIEGDGSTGVELSDGSTAPVRELIPVAFGCPVCGTCHGPAVERPGLRPCLDCLVELRRIERDERAVEESLRALRRRAVAGRATATELGDHGLEELARERSRWAESVHRRPREERRGKMLAAYAHAYALWAGQQW